MNKMVDPNLINEAKMLEEIRALLNLTIEKFVYQMNWPNTKYYDYIKNGRKRTGEKFRKTTHPSIFKIFNGINFAIDKYDNWKEQASAITSIVVKHLMPWNKIANS